MPKTTFMKGTSYAAQ